MQEVQEVKEVQMCSTFILALCKIGYTIWSFCRVESGQGEMCNHKDQLIFLFELSHVDPCFRPS